jgi:squalene-hopene/tetraprenyl-beta-curcumene cyclase
MRAIVLMVAVLLQAQEPPLPDLAPNAADEPFAERFSYDRAGRFLDESSAWWQRKKKCMTCHTNFTYVLSVSEVDARRPAYAAVRRFTEELVTERPERPRNQRWDTEVVITAAALSVGDANAGGPLRAATRLGLDRMWTLQREDGTWDWGKCEWPPMESDDYYGVMVALLAVGRAPGDYASTPAAREGLGKIRAYLAKTPAPSVHHQGMLLWASKYVDGLMVPEERTGTLDRLLSLQRPDGGWSAASLGNWKRADGLEQDVASSDGYGTGFVVYVARQGGVPADDPRIRRGVEWLKTRQRQSGRWYTRSLHSDGKHYLTHAGTAFALLALHACGEKLP